MAEIEILKKSIGHDVKSQFSISMDVDNNNNFGEYLTIVAHARWYNSNMSYVIYVQIDSTIINSHYQTGLKYLI